MNRFFVKEWNSLRADLNTLFMESLILAQNERWRHGLGMQVERTYQYVSGERVRNA